MKVYSIICEGKAVNTAEDLKNAFTRQQWLNIFASLGHKFLKGRNDARKFSGLQDMNNLLGQKSTNVSPADWDVDAQLYGLNTPFSGPGLSWQQIYDHLEPHKDKPTSISEPKIDKTDPVKTKVDKTETLSMVSSWVPHPEKEELTKEEAEKYWKAFNAKLKERATDDFANYWTLPTKDGKANILQKLYDHYISEIKKDVADGGTVTATRVRNLYSAWLDTYLDTYRETVGVTPFK